MQVNRKKKNLRKREKNVNKKNHIIDLKPNVEILFKQIKSKY